MIVRRCISFLSAQGGDINGRMRVIFVLAAVLGLRNSEIRRLVWRDVDLAGMQLRIDMLHAKNRSPGLWLR